MERNQFTFYSSFWKAVARIKNKSARCDAYDAICRYAITGEEPDVDSLPDAAAIVLKTIRADIKKEIRQSIEGRRCAEYKEWRKKVYERDSYTCKYCGAKGVRLNAHHIKPYAIYINLRYSVPNGITLCEECHKLEHRKRVF